MGFLTFFYPLFLDICPAAAADGPGYTGYDRPPNSAIADNERRQKTGELLGYLRQKWQGWIPGLPLAIRNPTGWLKSSLTLDETNAFASYTQPVGEMMQQPEPGETKATWLTPDYHHKGFLPRHDAMIMGVNLRQPVIDTLSMNAHPFLGQNWHNSEGYWGSEFAFNLGQANAANPAQSWGKLVLRYSNGDTSLLDRSRGFDMHGEMNFDERFALHAGVNQNNDSGSYMLLRWKLILD